MTYVRGKHNIKFGTENRFYYYNVRTKSGSGDFNFSPNQTAEPGFTNQTGHSFASFLLGAYASSSRGCHPAISATAGAITASMFRTIGR